MVVDKDVEGLGEWTLGEVKTEWVCTLTVLLFRWKTQSRGYVCTIGQLSLHWMIGAGLVWCAGASPTLPCWPPSMLVTASPFILQLYLYLSELPLHLGVSVSLNVSTFSLIYFLVPYPGS